MIRAWIRKRLAAPSSDAGTATVEFVLTAPVVIFTFLAAFESGVYMVRYVLLDRSLDMTVRELRLGMIETPALENLKGQICSRLRLVDDCENALRLQMFSINTATWTFPDPSIECQDRSKPIKTDEPNLGVENEVMLIRACLTADAYFPTTGLAAQMTLDPSGGYYIAAASGFVNEP